MDRKTWWQTMFVILVVYLLGIVSGWEIHKDKSHVCSAVPIIVVEECLPEEHVSEHSCEDECPRWRDHKVVR